MSKGKALAAALVLALALLVAAPIVLAATVQIEAFPELTPYAVINTQDRLNAVVANIVPAGNVSLSITSDGYVLITDTVDNASGVVTLNTLFAYTVAPIEGSCYAGYFYSNGTPILAFQINVGEEALIYGGSVYIARANGTIEKNYIEGLPSDAVPGIMVSDGASAKIKLVAYEINLKEEMSAPAPPFTPTGTWSGTSEGERIVQFTGRIQVAFWEGHQGYDYDLLVSSERGVLCYLLADNGRWQTSRWFTNDDAGSYLRLQVRQLRGTGSWMVVWRIETASATVTNQPSPTTSSPVAPIPENINKDLLLGALAGAALIAIALFIIMGSHGHRHRRAFGTLEAALILLLIATAFAVVIALLVKPELALYTAAAGAAFGFAVLLVMFPTLMHGLKRRRR